MLSFLRAPVPKRTKFAHQSIMLTENGRSSVRFASAPNLVSKQATIAFTLPPSEAGPNPRDNSFNIPPVHLHPRQEEFFLVTSGNGLFTLDGREIVVPAGEKIVIPRGGYHRFTNASATAPMTLEAWYDPADHAREERFFRNLSGYLEDCASDGKAVLGNASLAQLALFCWEADVMLCEPMLALKIPKSIGVPAAVCLTWFLGVFIGNWMLGYKSTYEEYYHKGSD
ncbi:cupin [Phlyctema vagabunda]|uniref:Cupin n=1 Tax=Phlyctema vagabunda TaxID=108571 RepID=A0ABR4PER4_9HELO